MWKRILPVLFGLSLAVNLAVIGAWSLHRLRGGCRGHRRPEAGPTGLVERVGVAPERAEAVQASLHGFRGSMRETCRGIESLRLELLDAIAADPEDREAIAARREALMEAQRSAQARVVEHLASLAGQLSPEERGRFFDLLRAHGGCGGPGRVLGMPRDPQREGAACPGAEDR